MFPSAVMRVLGSLLSGSGRAAKLLILAYHRVLPRIDPLLDGVLDEATFEGQMSLLAQRFTVMPLTEAATRLAAGTLPPRAVCITFDDGYADNFSIAFPILAKHGLTATFFIATGFLDGGRMWNDTVIESVRRAQGDELDLRDTGAGIYFIGDMQARLDTVHKLLNELKYLSPDERLRKTEVLADRAKTNLPNDLMMTSEQVRQLQSGGMDIGAHTVNHPILTRLTIERAEQEISRARTRLHDIGVRKVNAFAYPNGRPGIDYDRGHVEAVRRAGFRAAVSTAWGCARCDTESLELPRIAPWGHTSSRFNLRLLKTYIDPPAGTAS